MVLFAELDRVCVSQDLGVDGFMQFGLGGVFADEVIDAPLG